MTQRGCDHSGIAPCGSCKLEAEIARLRAALDFIRERDWYWGAPWNPLTGHNTRHQGFYGKYAEHALNEQSADLEGK